jgi:uncharacterized membrane protein
MGYDEASTRETYGISEEFVKQVGGMVQLCRSALIALVRAADPDVAVDQVRGYGGTILRTTLDVDRTSQLQVALAGRA